MKNNSTFQSEKQPIYRCDGKPIGYVEGDTFYKTAIASKHMLRKPLGWASDIDILKQAEQHGAIHFVIKDSGTKTKYKAAIQDFWKHGISFDRKHGKQIVLPLKFWRIDRPGQPSQLPQQSQPAETQLTLPF